MNFKLPFLKSKVNMPPVQPIEKKEPLTLKNKKEKNFLVKAIGIITNYSTSRGEFQESEYDLEEIGRAAEADSYISIALQKYNQLIYKAGYVLKSDNDKAVDYIKTRFKIMSLMTNKPMDILFQEVAEDLVKYSNAFLLKSRVEKIGFGVKANIVDELLPIGGYFRASPEKMKIKRNKNGVITGYELHNDKGEKKKFVPEDVIHFYMDKKADNGFGTPRITTALEDVKLLRRIEGNIISLIYRFAIPLYQWKLGLAQEGFQATKSEIDEAKHEVENMALDGIIFTNEKTEIKSIGVDGTALDCNGYLNYFEKRVLTALNLSEAQIGRSSNASTADSMEAQTHDTVKHIQRTLSIFIENFILGELLIEGGFNPILNEKDWVYYCFNEISLDTKVKLENHEMAKFQNNIHTWEESRTHMGMRNDKVDEERLYANMITKKIAMEQADKQNECAIKLANVNAENTLKQTKLNSTTGGKAGNNGTVQDKKTKDVENKNMPENQYGKTSVKIKESYENNNKKADNQKKYKEIYKIYNSLSNDIIEGKSDIDLLFQESKDNIVKAIHKNMDEISKKAMIDVNNEIKPKNIKLAEIDLSYFDKENASTIKEVFKDIKQKLNSLNNISENDVKIIFSTYEYRIRYLLEYIIPKIYWYSYIKQGAFLGKKNAYIIFDSEKDSENHPSKIDTNDFKVEDIPAYHSFCKCKVSFKRKED